MNRIKSRVLLGGSSLAFYNKYFPRSHDSLHCRVYSESYSRGFHSFTSTASISEASKGGKGEDAFFVTPRDFGVFGMLL